MSEAKKWTNWIARIDQCLMNHDCTTLPNVWCAVLDLFRSLDAERDEREKLAGRVDNLEHLSRLQTKPTPPAPTGTPSEGVAGDNGELEKRLAAKWDAWPGILRDAGK